MPHSDSNTPAQEGCITDEEAEGCTWQYPGSYPDTPPEYCDNDVDPGEEYCLAHKEKAAAIERWESEAELT